MNICCANNWGLSEYGDIANIIIAGLTLFLGYYVLVYQKKQDDSNVKLQWLKELIIQPKLNEVYTFYNNIGTVKNKIDSNSLTDNQKIELIDFIKREHSILRKSFINVLQMVTPQLYLDLYNNLDNLIDGLTRVIDNDELKLNNEQTYNREIASKIEDSYNKFFASIFNHKG